jgi:hypothetical protein
MIRPTNLSLVLAAGLGLCACSAKPTTPTLSYMGASEPRAMAPAADTIGTALAQAPAAEPGRILRVRQDADLRFAYTIQRIRDDTVIEVSQADRQPLPAGLKVSINYGSPVHIEAAPTTPDLD